MKLKTMLEIVKNLPQIAMWKLNEKKFDAIGSDFRGELREYPSFEKDEKTGKTYVEVIFKEGTTPDLTKLPKKLGLWEVRHEFRKPYMNFGALQELFNANAAAISAVQEKVGKDMIGMSMNCDKKTSGPVLTFVFEEKSKPDLAQLPDAIGPFKVVHEFRPIPKLL
jgi:hypothetical protein